MVKLRNACLNDEELKEKEFKGDPFGNPFRRTREDFDIFSGNNKGNYSEYEMVKRKNIENLNKGKDYTGDNVFYDINNTAFVKNDDDDLSVFPIPSVGKKTKRSKSAPNRYEDLSILNKGNIYK